MIGGGHRSSRRTTAALAQRRYPIRCDRQPRCGVVGRASRHGGETRPPAQRRPLARPDPLVGASAVLMPKRSEGRLTAGCSKVSRHPTLRALAALAHVALRAETPSRAAGCPLSRRDQVKTKQMQKAAAISEHQRTRKPLFHRHSPPPAITYQTPDRFCKQEVAGSIPAGSIRTIVYKRMVERHELGGIQGANVLRLVLSYGSVGGTQCVR